MNALITGGTKGIGRAVVHEFANAGYDIITCARDEGDLEDLKKDLGNRYETVKCHCYQVNLSKKNEIKKWAKSLREEFSDLDILVNNAGRYIKGKITEEKDHILEDLLHINVVSAYYLTRELLKLLKNSPAAHIFNMASIAGLQAYPDSGSYTISKFAMMGFSKSLRQDLLEDNIKVTTVIPGATWSSSWEGSGIDPGRIMAASDVAKMIFSAAKTGPNAVVEEIVMRPLKGDL